MDAWHWFMAGQKFEDFNKFTSPDQIVCAHIMDAPANVPAEEQEDLVRRLPGTTGIVPIEEFFAGLNKVGYEGPVLVEPFERFLSMIGFEEAVGIVKKSMDKVWPKG
jgi:2-keto-myo-inositol isomerase